MRLKKVLEGYGTSYNDLKSGTSKPTDFDKVLDKTKQPVKATDKKGSQVDVISTAGEEDVVVQHKNKKKEIIKSKDLTVEDIALEYKLKKATSIKNKYRKLTNKLARKHLKEQPAELYEINFRQKEVAKEGLDAPVKCGFEAETFFYSVEGSSNDVDEMSLSDIEYEYGDMPDQVWEDFEDWLYTKGQDEYLDDIIDDKVQEFREDEDYLNDFIDSGDGPSSEAIERYKKDFEEEDPKEYENREEDGWEYMNWVREYVEEEYEEAYLDWLKREIREENDIDDEAKEAARDEYSVEDWIYDNYSYMSSFLDDYGYEYGGGNGDVEGVASELNNWIQDNSKFTDYPDSGDYGDTYTTTAWAVEKDSSIDPDEGTGAELISPVFNSPRQMLTEMKSLFDWSETNFGTNNTTGLHVTMSWQGENATDENNVPQQPNKLKMALLLGDEYLLAQFNRLSNSYTKSQYQNVLKTAERMKAGDLKAFEDFEKQLAKGISSEKFQSIHFKGESDNDSGNNLIEFRIAGGSDYNQMFTKVFNATIRYATIMKAGYDEDAFREDYVKAVFRVLRKSQEIDPKKLKDLEVFDHPVIDSAKNIVGKQDYFEMLRLLNSAVEYYNEYKENSNPDADKKWKQSIKDYEKGTGDNVEIEEVEQGEPIQGYMKPNSIAPSKRALGSLKKAQERFISAITIISRDIANGQARSTPKAKDIGNFRKFATQLKMDDATIESDALSQVRRLRTDQDSDEKSAKMLSTGINALFKKEIVKMPDFIKKQDFDPLADGMWQFFQSEDIQDNLVVEKLVELLYDVTHKLYTKDDIRDNLKVLSKKRQKNEVYRSLKDTGYHSNIALFKPGSITDKKALEKTKKFLSKYQGYEHPTSPDHHINIRSDDNYENVFTMNLTQKLRNRLSILADYKDSEPEKYNKITKQLLDIGKQTVDIMYEPNTKKYDSPEQMIEKGDIKKYNGWGQIENDDEWEREYLAMSTYSYDRANKFLDDIKRDPDQYNFGSAFDDFILAETVGIIQYYFKNIKKAIPGKAVESYPPVRKFITNNFKAIKKLLTTIDKIFQAEGFANLGKEIKNKNVVNRRNKDFEKNIRDKTNATINIPSHSFVYTDVFFVNDLGETDPSNKDDERGRWFNNIILPKLKGSDTDNPVLWIIPSAHWSQADDAKSGLELISTFEKNNNYYHSWRKTGYRKILSKFRAKYGISFQELTGEDYEHSPDRLKQELNRLGVEVTHIGDSRAGAPGIKDLVDKEELKNPVSGEPIDRSSATMWNQDDDEEKERKRFKAFDWNVYPQQMKALVDKELKDMKDEQGFYSFKVALETILKRVLDGDTGIELGPNNTDLKAVAGVEHMEGDASNSIANETNWINLANYLKIEKGVESQGVELLKKTYRMFDSNGEGEFAANGHSMERWLDAVKKANDYIVKNYTVSGGNYFRKDAEGNAGDDVGKVYGTSDDEGRADYDKARENFRLFNVMMQQGMQNYLPRGEVNKLVAFLNNPQQDNNFKIEVLSIIRRDGPFDTFMGAVNAAKEISQESIFTKFDKLPLQEQLRIVSESKVLEGTRCWKGYKKKGTKKMFGKTVPNCVKNEDVTQLKPQTSGTKKPTFSKQNAQKAFEEWSNGAAVDTDIEIVGNDNQLYYIRQNTDGDSQHFKDDHWYLTDANNTIVDTESYPDPGNLLFSHSAEGYEPIHPDDLDENFADGKPGSSITLYNVKGEKKVFTVDKVSPTGSMMVSGNGLNRIIVGNTPNAVTFNVRDPNYKIRAPGFQMQGKAVRDISPADLDNAIMQIKNTIKTFPKNQLGYNDLLADYFALKFKKDSDTVNSMQHENFADGKKKGKSKPGRVKRAGASCNGSVTDLKAKAKKYSGEKGKMYQWCANMKSGKKKANEELANKLKLTVKANAISESLMMTEVDRVKDINDILSAEFPVNNYKLQMKAFVALPVPAMLDAFKDLHARYGAKSDAREIVRHFAKSRMPKEQLTKINLGV